MITIAQRKSLITAITDLIMKNEDNLCAFKKGFAELKFGKNSKAEFPKIMGEQDRAEVFLEIDTELRVCGVTVYSSYVIDATMHIAGLLTNFKVVWDSEGRWLFRSILERN